MNDPVSEYKRFIDGLVATRDSDVARRVREGVWRPRTSDPLKFSEVLAKLSVEQREVIGEIVQGAADAAIQDVLVFLADQGFGLSRGGVEVAERPFGTELGHDFAARRDGAEWPDQKLGEGGGRA